MKPYRRAEALFEKAKKLTLINPITNEGAPTFGMVHEAIEHAANDAAQEADELAFYVRRLVRVVRKTEPTNDAAAKAVEFLKCVGRLKPLR